MTLGSIHKQVSVMLNIKLSSGGGLPCVIWHMAESRRIHSQELLLLYSTTACLACYGYTKQSTRIDKLSLQQYRACVVDSLGLGIMCLISLYYVNKASRS